MSPNPSFIDNETNNCERKTTKHGQVLFKVKLFEINTDFIEEIFQNIDKRRSISIYDDDHYDIDSADSKMTD